VISENKELKALRVHPNGRYLMQEDGLPFFWLADTAWFIRRLSPQEIDLYLETRARQRFNVIQIAPASSAGYTGPDFAGETPFRDSDSMELNEPFWQNIDAFIEKAAARGIYTVIFPLWGQDYARLIGRPDTAYNFGLDLGKRYARHTSVMWAVSGEYDSINGFKVPITGEQMAVIDAAARGLREAHGCAQLMSIHPGIPRSSSKDFHARAWLDFNMLQSGHAIDCEEFGLTETHSLISDDWKLEPAKPVLDGEPIYEDTPDAIWILKDRHRARAKADAMRRKAYWSIFAGACGHTYGHNDVWNFFTPDNQEGIHTGASPRGYWKAALETDGANQMQHVRALMETFALPDRIPDQGLLVVPAGKGNSHIRATRSAAGKFALVYLPMGGTVTVALNRISSPRVSCAWFDPRTGQSTEIGNFPNTGNHTFASPGEARLGNDWVLVLENDG
jgi:hypothetical protein